MTASMGRIPIFCGPQAGTSLHHPEDRAAKPHLARLDKRFLEIGEPVIATLRVVRRLPS